MQDAPTVVELVGDLHAETAELDVLVAGLTEAGWDTATPSPGWTIRHQIAHLAWTDQITLGAAANPDQFRAEMSALDPLSVVDRAADEGAALPTGRLLDRWREGRVALCEMLVGLPPGTKIPWFVTPMTASSMATARLMETFAHGQDVLDALGRTREYPARVRHVAYLGFRARDHAFRTQDLPVPETGIRLDLTGPGGETWTYGPPDAPESISGPAVDFALLVTRRRHRGDLALVADGAAAEQWLDIAQAYAGPSGEGREAGQFA